MENNRNEVVRIRDRYEMTLPKKTRDFLQVNIGDVLEFTPQKDGSAIIHKVIYSRVKNNSNENYQPNDSEEKKKMELPEGGEERTQPQGGEKIGQQPEMGENKRTGRDTHPLHKVRAQLENQTRSDDARTPDQQRENQKERIKDIGGEAPYEWRNKENR